MSRTRPRIIEQDRTAVVQRRGIQNREAIIKAAHEEFGRLGFHGARMRSIAESAGMKYGHLSYYFRTKDALWREITEMFIKQCQVPLSQAADRLDGGELETVARGALLELLNLFATNPDMLKLLQSELYQSSPRYAWLYDHLAPSLWKSAQPLFEALHDAGFLCGVSAYLAYSNFIGGGLMAFGFPQERTRIADGVPIDSFEDRCRYLLRPVFARAE